MKFVEGALVLMLAGTASAGVRIHQMFVFGDSYSDTGAGYVDGNGPTAVAYLAQALSIKLLPANQHARAEDSLNFAVSGAQTGSGKGEAVKQARLGYGMTNQVDDFERGIENGTIRFVPETTLFFFAGGLNDRQLPTTTTIANLEREIRTVYSLGGRHFRVALMPTAIPAFSEVGLRLNPALQGIPAQMPGLDVKLSNWGPFFDEVIEHPAKYGITNTVDACAGRAIFGENDTPCQTPDRYFYYHKGHPSTAVHKIVGGKMAAEMK